jgi:hypothetical protein
MAKSADGHTTGAALVDHCCDARMNADQIGIEAKLTGNMLVDVGVGIDHSRDNQMVSDRNPVHGRPVRQAWGDFNDFAAADRNVGDTVMAARWINDTPPGKNGFNFASWHFMRPFG